MKAAVKEVILLNGKGNEAGRVRLGSEIHRGGAGAVYRLDSMPGRVLKVYNSATLSKEGRAYQAKVIQMVAQPPVLPPCNWRTVRPGPGRRGRKRAPLRRPKPSSVSPCPHSRAEPSCSKTS